MMCQEAIGEHADVGVQRRVQWHSKHITSEMHLLALRQQLTNGADPLAHELPVGHAVWRRFAVWVVSLCTPRRQPKPARQPG